MFNACKYSLQITLFKFSLIYINAVCFKVGKQMCILYTVPSRTFVSVQWDFLASNAVRTVFTVFIVKYKVIIVGVPVATRLSSGYPRDTLSPNQSPGYPYVIGN